MHFRRSIPLLVTLLALAVLESSDATTGGEHQKSLPSIEQIRRFFATIDQSVIDRIRSTVKIATLVSKLRKIFQFKQQLREGLNKRTELNGNGLKSIDKSLKMLLSPTMWTSKLRSNKNQNEKPVENTSMESAQHIVTNHITDTQNYQIEAMNNIKP